MCHKYPDGDDFNLSIDEEEHVGKDEKYFFKNHQ